MKTSLLIMFALLMTTSIVRAQHANIGIKGGLNSYTIQGDNSSNNNYKIGYHIGLLSHFHMGSQFALQPEVTFSTQGTTIKGGGAETDINLNYLNVPVLFQYMFDNGFRLEMGPQLGFLTSAKSESGNTSRDIKDNYKSTDIALAMGMSYVKPSTGFGFDIRYNHGLTNINETNNGNAFNSGFQFGLFYLFKHKS